MATSMIINTPSAYSEASFFSIKRFGAYFKYYIASNSKNLWLSAAIILVGAFAIQLLLFYSTAVDTYVYNNLNGISETEWDAAWRGRCDIYGVILIGIMIIAGSKMFSEIAQRADRLRTLELPASQFEKFMTWFIIYLPATIIISWICFWITDMLICAWAYVFTPFGNDIKLLNLYQIITMEPKGIADTQDILGLTAFYSIAVIFNALYAAGNIIFHRLSFLKTSISLFILGCIVSILIFMGMNVFYPEGIYDTAFELSDYDSTVIIASGSAAIYLLIYWFCYARFKQEEIIARL